MPRKRRRALCACPGRRRAIRYSIGASVSVLILRAPCNPSVSPPTRSIRRRLFSIKMMLPTGHWFLCADELQL